MVNKISIQTKLTASTVRHRAFRELLSSKERTYLVDRGKVHAVDTGTVLCRQEKLEDRLYVILLGEMDVIEKVNGKELLVGKLSTGDLVGEIGALFTVPRIASVVATVPTVVLELLPNVFSELIDKTPNLHGAVYQGLYERSLETALCSAVDLSKEKQGPSQGLSRLLSCWQYNQYN